MNVNESEPRGMVIVNSQEKIKFENGHTLCYETSAYPDDVNLFSLPSSHFYQSGQCLQSTDLPIVALTTQ